MSWQSLESPGLPFNTALPLRSQKLCPQPTRARAHTHTHTHTHIHTLDFFNLEAQKMTNARISSCSNPFLLPFDR